MSSEPLLNVVHFLSITYQTKGRKHFSPQYRHGRKYDIAALSHNSSHHHLIWYAKNIMTAETSPRQFDVCQFLC